jgi:ketosteroid isomerase-like protein
VTELPPAPWSAALLRAEIDAVLADWAWYIDHGDYDSLVSLYTPDALLVTGGLELRGRDAIKQRYTERTGTRSTRHTYSGLRLTGIGLGDTIYRSDGHGAGSEQVELADRVEARSTWVNYAANAAAPIDDVGVYLVADFADVLVANPYESPRRWYIAERRIIPVFRDPTRAPA